MDWELIATAKSNYGLIRTLLDKIDDLVAQPLSQAPRRAFFYLSRNVNVLDSTSVTVAGS